MIKDFSQDFISEEEQAEFSRLQFEALELSIRRKELMDAGDEVEPWELFSEKVAELTSRADEIQAKAERRYMDRLKAEPDLIARDARSILEELTEEDYQEHEQRRKENPLYLPEATEIHQDDYSRSAAFAFRVLRLQVNAASELAEDPAALPEDRQRLDELKEKATAWAAQFFKPAKKEAPVQLPDKVEVKRTLDRVAHPLDTMNTRFWPGLLEEADGQFSFAYRDDADAVIVWAIDFPDPAQLEALHITKKLEPFDLRLLIFVDQLYRNGETVFSVTRLAKVAGLSDKPSTKLIEKINNSLTKCRAATLNIDNASEVAEGKASEEYKYDGDLFPFERVTKSVNGRIVEGLIHPLRTVPVIDFAHARGQICLVPAKVYLSPINKNNTQLAVEHYLIHYLSRFSAPGSKTDSYITLDAIRKWSNYKGEGSRLRSVVVQLLDHYVSIPWAIKGYKLRGSAARWEGIELEKLPAKALTDQSSAPKKTKTGKK